MKFKATLNGIKVEIEVPTGWRQVDFGTYLALCDAGHKIHERLHVITHIEVETLKKSVITNLDKLIMILNFIDTQPNQDKLPDKVLGYSIPKDLEFQTTERYEDLKQICSEMKENTTKDIKRYSELVACYACPEPYDWKDAEKLAPEFLKAPCEEVLAVGNFTLLKLAGLSLNTKIPYPSQVTLMTKFRLVSKALLKRLAVTLRSYFSKRKPLTNATNY